MNKTILLTLLLMISSAAQADMTVSLKSETGDYIGQGLTQTFNFTDAQMSTTASGTSVQITSNNGTHSMSIALASLHNVAGSLLANDMCYDRAQRSPFNTNGRPGLSVSMDGRGCNELMGRYRVREYTINAGHIQTLSLDFAQQCELGGPALFGNLRFNSAVSANTPFFDPVYTATGSFAFTATATGIGASAPGHAANIALSRQLVKAARNFDQGISIDYVGPLPGVTGSGFWSLDFAGPSDAVIVPGSYPNAVRFPFQPTGVPGLDFGYNGGGSNNVSGSFNVTTANYDPFDGLPTDFDATFVHNSEANTANQSNGHIIYHALFNNGGPTDRIFASGVESGEIPTSQISLAYPCIAP